MVMQHFICFDSINQTSPYYDDNLAKNAEFFEILNEGNLNKTKLFLIGDSHN